MSYWNGVLAPWQPMFHIPFTDEQIEQLNYERYHHPHPTIQRRMETLYLKSQGLAHQEICRLCRISRTTLAKDLRLYQQGGIDALKVLRYKGQPSLLNAHNDTLKAHFEKHPPRNTAEAQAAIEQLTGIKRSPTQIKLFLKRIGCRRRKVGHVPGKPDNPDKIDEQETFRREQLEPLLEEAKRGERVMFFLDAAHFVHRAYLGFVWCFSRVFIPSPSGRKRFNVLGAINALTKEVFSVTNQTYINSHSVCLMLVQLAQLDFEIPVTIVLDNARYQKCRLVSEFAQIADIELLYLPSYSPHLNLIERLWRFVRKECLYSKYYADFASFKAAIDNCLSEADGKHKPKLEKLLSLKFQSFKKVNLLNV